MRDRPYSSSMTRQEALRAITLLEREHPSHSVSYQYPEIQEQRDYLNQIAYPPEEQK